MAACVSDTNDDGDQAQRWKRFTNYEWSPEEIKSISKIMDSLNWFQPYFQLYKVKVGEKFSSEPEFKERLDDLDNVYNIYDDTLLHIDRRLLPKQPSETPIEMKSFLAKFHTFSYPMVYLFTSQFGHANWFSYAQDNSIIPCDERRRKQFYEILVVEEEDRLNELWKNIQRERPEERMTILRARLVRQMRELLFLELKHLQQTSPKEVVRSDGHFFRGETIASDQLHQFQTMSGRFDDIFIGLPLFSTSETNRVSLQFLLMSKEKDAQNPNTIPVLFRIQVVNIRSDLLAEFELIYPWAKSYLFKAMDISKYSKFPDEKEVLFGSIHAIVLECEKKGDSTYHTIDLLTPSRIHDLPSAVAASENRGLMDRWLTRLKEISTVARAQASPPLDRISMANQAHEMLMGYREDFGSEPPSSIHYYVVQNICVFQEAESYYKTKGATDKVLQCARVCKLCRFLHTEVMTVVH